MARSEGLEPPAPCLQSDVFVCCDRTDLVGGLSVSSREVPLLPLGNGTLMARDLVNPDWLSGTARLQIAIPVDVHQVMVDFMGVATSDLQRSEVPELRVADRGLSRRIAS